MTNETYRYAFMKCELAIADEESSALLFIRPNKRGKSDTAKILVKKFKPAVFIPVMSTSEQKNWFQEQLSNGTQIFILDDPAAWTFYWKDLISCILILKSLASGEFRASRGTKFDLNIPDKLDHDVCIIIFASEPQYSDIRLNVNKSGLGARLEKFLTTHTGSHFNELKNFYKTHGYSSRKNILPRFKVDNTDEFPEDFMESGRKGHYFNEVIEFEDIIIEDSNKKKI